MILSASENIEGKQVQVLGLVEGSTVQTVNAFRDIGASFKTLVGGEIVKYNEMMEKARELAKSRMVKQAEALGADAILSIRYSSSAIMQGAAEVVVYGTAVKTL
ncbi:MAG: YbjQ family protein [Lachnospiraceae bacterium]|nr:YbjQ family protein [Lachnospiraceae bacterium]